MNDFEYLYARVTSDQSGKDSVKELNSLLREGWRPIRECPFAGTSYSSGSVILVLLARRLQRAEVTVTDISEDVGKVTG